MRASAAMEPRAAPRVATAPAFRRKAPIMSMATTPTAPDQDTREAARQAALRYVSDDLPGITRRRVGKGFGYREPKGGPVRDAATLRRIRALAIPPAWKQVWICPHADGHIQATGRDEKGRKQYH